MANKGLKNYTKQITQTIGNVAKVSVNVNKEDANMHIVIPLITTLGPNPLDLSLIFNYQDINKNQGFGKGCSINTFKNVIYSDSIIEVIDADGSSILYEKNKDGNYYSKESSLKISKAPVVSDDGDHEILIMEDQQGNCISFDEYTLNITEISYVNGFRTLFDGVNMDNGYGAKITFTKANNVYSKATYTQEGSTLYQVNFKYDSNQRLTAVEHYKGGTLIKHLNIAYEASKIIIKDVISKDYAVYSITSNRIATIHEYVNGQTTASNTTSINYEDRKTTITDNDGKKVFIYFDSDNLPLFVIDEDGNALETTFDNTTKRLISKSSILPTKSILPNSTKLNINDFDIVNNNGISVEPVSINDGTLSNVVSQAYKISGKGKFRYSISVNGLGGDSYMAAIWGKFDEKSSDSARVEVTLIADKFVSESFRKSISKNNFHLKTLGVSAIKSYSNVVLIIELIENTTITIGGIQILKKDYGSIYHYDNNGNLVDAESAKGSIMSLYGSNGLKESSMSTNSSLYYYDYDKKGNLTKAIASYGGKVEHTYDSANNVTKSIISNASDSNKMEFSRTYEKNRFVTSETDESGNITNYTYDSYGKIKTITDALKDTTEYKYNAFDNITEILFNNSDSVKYTYDSKHRLDTATLPNNTVYKFNYDSYNNLNSVSVDNVVIVSYTYDPKTGLITQQKFGASGDTFNFVYYDKKPILKQVLVNNNLRYQYSYDKYDRLEKVLDKDGKAIKTYEYDNDGQITSVTENESIIKYDYDSKGNICHKKRELNSKVVHESFADASRSMAFSPDNLAEYLQRNNDLLGTMFTGDAKIKNPLYVALPYDVKTGGMSTATCTRKNHIPCVYCGTEHPICYNPPASNQVDKNSGGLAFWFYPTTAGKYLFTISGKDRTSIEVSIGSSGNLVIEVFNANGVSYGNMTMSSVLYNQWNFVGFSYNYRNDGSGYAELFSYELYLNDECKKGSLKQTILTEGGLYHIGYRYHYGQADSGLDSYITALMIGCRREISSCLQEYYTIAKDYITLGNSILDSEGNAVNLSTATSYHLSDTTLSQFEIYPLNNNVKSLNGAFPIAFDLRKEASRDCDRTFKYNNQIKRYAYAADGKRLEFDMENTMAGTIMMKAFIRSNRDKQYFLELKTANNLKLGLYRGSDNYLYLDADGTTRNTSLLFSTYSWHTIGLSFIVESTSGSVSTFKKETLRVYLDGKTFSMTLLDKNHSPIAVSLGKKFDNNSDTYPLMGQIEMLAIRKAYCEEATLKKLADELKLTTKVSQYDDTGLLYRKQIYDSNKSLLDHMYYYKNGFSRFVDSETIKYPSPSTSTSSYISASVTRSYTWDKLNRIEKITDSLFGTHTYKYNNRGFLEQEDTTKYEYDSNGNITKAGSTTFVYDTIIKDRLKKVNGKEITYEGNSLYPKSYNGNTYTFEGNRLIKYNNYSYTYNNRGLRTSKSLNTSITKYYYDGDLLITEDRPGCRLDFLYDENNELYGVIYNSSQRYYYVKDFMKNILGIIDSNGNLVVQYNYTAYGTKVSITGSQASLIGSYNPFRWKGYYCDSESGLYLVTTRYYNPEWCRWLNGDVANLNPFDINGMNLFNYCGNNPISYTQEFISKEIPVYLQGGLISCFIKPLNLELEDFNYIIASGSFRSGLFYGNGTITQLSASGYAGAKFDWKEKEFEFGAFFDVSLIDASGEIGIRNSNFSLSLVGDVNVGTLSGAAGIIINPKRDTYFLGIGLETEAVSVNAGIRMKIFNFEIEVGGYASVLAAGAYLGVGLKKGKFTGIYKSSALFGYGIYFNIKF